MFQLTKFYSSLSRFLRTAKSDTQGQLKASSRSIYILPSRFGIMYAVLIISMLVGSINYANNLGFLLTFFLAATGIIAIIHTWLNVLGLEFEIHKPEPVFAGKFLKVQVIIKNPTDKIRGNIQISLHKSSQVLLVNLLPGESKSIYLNQQTVNRGYMTLPKVLVESYFPLGLFCAWLYLPVYHKALIYPKPEKCLLPANPIHEEGDSETASDINGHNDFHSHRNYQKTDAASHIDWKVLARGKGMYSKQFNNNIHQNFMFSLDMFDGCSLEQAISRLSFLIIRAEKQGEFYGLLLDEEIPLSRGTQHYNQCLKALAVYKQ